MVSAVSARLGRIGSKIKQLVSVTRPLVEQAAVVISAANAHAVCTFDLIKRLTLELRFSFVLARFDKLAAGKKLSNERDQLCESCDQAE